MLKMLLGFLLAVSMLMPSLGCQTMDELKTGLRMTFGIGADAEPTPSPFDIKRAEEEARMEPEVEPADELIWLSEEPRLLEEVECEDCRGDSQFPKNPDAAEIAEKHRAEYWTYTVHQVNADYAVVPTDADYVGLYEDIPHYVYEIPHCLYAEKTIMPYMNNKATVAKLGEEKAWAYIDAATQYVNATYTVMEEDHEVNVIGEWDISTIYQSVDGIRIRVWVAKNVRESPYPEDEDIIGVWGTTVVDVLFALDDNGDIQDAICIELAEWADLVADEAYIDKINGYFGY